MVTQHLHPKTLRAEVVAVTAAAAVFCEPARGDVGGLAPIALGVVLVTPIAALGPVLVAVIAGPCLSGATCAWSCACGGSSRLLRGRGGPCSGGIPGVLMAFF